MRRLVSPAKGPRRSPVVLVSGLAEITLGAALIGFARGRVGVGLLTAAFLVAIFPGNFAQYVGAKDAFGLETDRKRFVRLSFHPVLVLWAVWSTANRLYMMAVSGDSRPRDANRRHQR